jgi:hypothetical protein
VHAQVGLAIALKIQRPQRDLTVDRSFENSGTDCLAFVDDQPRARDIERNKLQRFLP